MTSANINLVEILFGEEFTNAVDKAKTELEAQAAKQQIFLKLKNLLNLMKRLPSLPDEYYAQILEGITLVLVKKTKLALAEKKRITMKNQLTLLFFKQLKLDQQDQKKMSKIITDYFKEEMN